MRQVSQPWMAEVTSRAPRNAIDGLDTVFRDPHCAAQWLPGWCQALLCMLDKLCVIW